MNSSVHQHDLKKAYGLQEDAWENYLYHDSKHAVSLICHNQALPISELIILTKFIEESINNETISQFVIDSPNLFIADLINFAKEFDLDSSSIDNDIIDSEEEESSGVALNGLL